jgi:integrase/recombinase XerD
MRGQGFADASVEQRRRCLNDLIGWLARRRCTRVGRVTPERLVEWSSDLAERRKADGCALAMTTRANLIYAVRGFFRAVTRRGVIRADPAVDLRVSSAPPPLPRGVPAVNGILRILETPDLRTRLGQRDRTILELLYATGIRRGEIIRLHVQDVDVARNTLVVRRGKGGRDRVVPTGSRAARWVESYLRKVRPQLASKGSGTVLFLTRRGKALCPNTLGDRLRPYVRVGAAAGSCHVFRHACATHMLEGGADIRYVQEMLGHASLTTTQIYTRVSIGSLAIVHAATHPSAAPARSRRRRGATSRVVEMPGLFRLPCRRAGRRPPTF